MIGKCPHCNIDLKKPPQSNRETNEMIVIMNYRRILDTGGKPKKIDDLGYCEVCNATKKDHEKQQKLITVS